MTQKMEAQRGMITKEMERVAADEGVSPEWLREKIASGRIVIPMNRNRKRVKPVGIGEGLRIKVNTNLGTSSDHIDLEEELNKLRVSIQAGTDTVMDLSTGGDIDAIRKEIIRHTPIPMGTVPIYEAAIEAAKKRGALAKMEVEDLFEVIERQAEEGVDFMTLHCGVTRNTVERLKQSHRLLGVVSRGGSFLVEWMIYNDQENPLYEHYDRILEIAKKHDVTLSLGDGLRPGCLADATDRPQVQETIILGELTERAWTEGVQVMIEGPGHVPLDQVEANILLEKRLCRGAPFYVLGPLVTDISPGYDHITCAIGGAIAGRAGADFLCYVTPSEHLKLPTVEDVREGVIATRIAGHAADIARGNKKAIEQDMEMSKARKAFDWEKQIGLSIDPEKARRYHEEGRSHTEEVCTMCGEFCAIKRVKDFFNK
ncbi:MAG: phosphomethylpyrimidine synthase ThiC [Deltaproteobacteria bacterium]|nr:phosphomethylpyrimidine synthase ThiC [Deltaproteobacteria bacterium]MBM4323876.1 phosphomethylpyrimidine synthase ThiC [Deltaproteobacteria bacterium]MBM4347040.1 phosphomethylpyrimidine synthase ThiC [Deltaproteobacteria bacterium]